MRNLHSFAYLHAGEYQLVYSLINYCVKCGREDENQPPTATRPKLGTYYRSFNFHWRYIIILHNLGTREKEKKRSQLKNFAFFSGFITNAFSITRVNSWPASRCTRDVQYHKYKHAVDTMRDGNKTSGKFSWCHCLTPPHAVSTLRVFTSSLLLMHAWRSFTRKVLVLVNISFLRGINQ